MTIPRLNPLRSLLMGGALTALVGIAPASAQNLIVNGSFDQSGSFAALPGWVDGGRGNYATPGFSSEYGGYFYDLIREGAYAIGASNDLPGGNTRSVNPKNFNSNFRTMTSDKDGTGTMLLVNGSNIVDISIWQSQVIHVDPGWEYEFVGYVTNINEGGWSGWAESLPKLGFEVRFNETGTWQSVGDILDMTLNPDTANEWHELRYSFEAGFDVDRFEIRLVNWQDAANGNDFALDALSLTHAAPIPEPSTIALLAMAGAAGLYLRRRK